MARKQVKKQQIRKRRPSAPASFGPVSTINTAPVSVGNSVRGSKPVVRQTTDGARITGRDFAFALSGTSSLVTGWELIGGMPLTPCVLPSSILRNYCQMFQKFKFNRVAVHYITSSPTSQAGDIMFYYERDGYAPMVDYSNSSFLPYVLSDAHTMIGPQWTNHSMLVTPTSEWKSTLYGNQTDINEDKNGTLWLFSKTNAANSPGYLLIDYDISFKELAVNPRAGTLPIARGQSQFIGLYKTGAVVTGTQAGLTDFTTAKTITGSTGQAIGGIAKGDIYKCIVQQTATSAVNPAWTNATASTLFQYYSDSQGIALDDGYTVYARYDGINFYLYSTLEGAVTNTTGLVWGVTANITVYLCMECHLVRNVDTLTQSAY